MPAEHATSLLGPLIHMPRHLRRAAAKAWMAKQGWTVEPGTPNVDKAVIIAYPHTSNWDLAYMLAAAYVLDIDISWLGKKELFRFPQGLLMRALGGVAVDRSQRTNMVDAMVDAVNKESKILVVIPPEGTRSRADRWKTGFYWLAVGAKIPIVLGYLDYGKQRVGLGHLLYPTGDIEKDFEDIRTYYKGMKGKFPELQGEIAIAK